MMIQIASRVLVNLGGIFLALILPAALSSLAHRWGVI